MISGSPDLECEASEAMLRLLVSLVLVLVGGSLTGAVPQGGGETTTTESPSSLYWWLGLEPSPFGGKNYNFDEAGALFFLCCFVTVNILRSKNQ